MLRISLKSGNSALGWLEAIALRLEAITSRLEAMTLLLTSLVKSILSSFFRMTSWSLSGGLTTRQRVTGGFKKV